MKYPTPAEAEDSFQRLLLNLQEMNEINDDIVKFMRSFEYAMLPSSPFFAELLDLHDNSTTTQQQSIISIASTQNSNFNTQEVSKVLNGSFWL